MGTKDKCTIIISERRGGRWHLETLHHEEINDIKKTQDAAISEHLEKQQLDCV